jgi:hypothetical protein
VVLSVRRSKKSFVNLSRMVEDVRGVPASTSLGGGTGFEFFECFELLRPNEKRDEGAIVEVGENLEVSTEMSGRLTERCSRNFELIVEGSEGGTKRKRKKTSGRDS